MNSTVRSYLIEIARIPDKFVSYSDVVSTCDLRFDLATEYGRHQLSITLGEVSSYEFEHNRPLLSSLVIYSDATKNDHGDGFYKLAETLGIGEYKKLKINLYAFEEAARCRLFWQNEHNYQQYFLSNDVPKFTSDNHSDKETFFTIEELDFFKEWQYKPYDPNNEGHKEAKNKLVNTVWEKSVYLGRRIISQLPGFSLDGRKYWSQRGWKEVDGEKVQASIFKPYTWVKISRNSDKGRDIYFTFGVEAQKETEAFVYKIDCRNTRDSNLNAEQLELCKSLIAATPSAGWNEIAFDDLVTMNWESLTAVCLQFIQQHLVRYDKIIEAVWGSPIVPMDFKNMLIRKNKPQSSHKEFPTSERSFVGVDIDFGAKAKEQKDLGNTGEVLVKQYEINKLINSNRKEDAAKVDFAKDGEGYDVLSFDEEGNLKYIEVKTTTGNQFAPFYLSENESEFMKKHVGSYCIYRIYNYDRKNNFGEFFEIRDNVESQLLLKPTNYMVVIKSEES